MWVRLPPAPLMEGRKGVLMRLENVDVRRFGRESSSPSPSSSLACGVMVAREALDFKALVQF